MGQPSDALTSAEDAAATAPPRSPDVGATDQRRRRPAAGVLVVAAAEPGVTRPLADAGLAVVASPAGPEALRAIAHRRPDVVVLDLDAAAAAGFRLLRRLKRAGPPAPPVLALTALNRWAAQSALWPGQTTSS